LRKINFEKYTGVYTLKVVPKGAADEGDFLARAKEAIEKIKANITCMHEFNKD
jgi:hypothetical protein